MGSTRVLLLVLTFMAPAAFGQTLLDSNIMLCELAGGLQRNCRIPEGIELAPRQETESEFYVSYTFGCDRKYSGPQASKVQLRLETGAALTLNYKDAPSKVLIGTGHGPLTLIDTFPKELAYRSFNDCQLSFSELKIVPSSRVQSVWQAELAGHEALIESKLALLASLEKVAVLLPAYQFFRKLSESLESDLKQDEEVLKLTRELSICKQGDDCDLLFKMSSDPSLSLTLEERLLIMQVRGLLAEVSASNAHVTLSDRMSEFSIRILNKLADQASFYEGAEANIAQTQREIEELRGKIEILKAQLAIGKN